MRGVVKLRVKSVFEIPQTSRRRGGASPTSEAKCFSMGPTEQNPPAQCHAYRMGGKVLGHRLSMEKEKYRKMEEKKTSLIVLNDRGIHLHDLLETFARSLADNKLPVYGVDETEP